MMPDGALAAQNLLHLHSADFYCRLLFAFHANITDQASGPLYVPLDSWVYPAFKRLAALGYLPDQKVWLPPGLVPSASRF